VSSTTTGGPGNGPNMSTSDRPAETTLDSPAPVSASSTYEDALSPPGIPTPRGRISRFQEELEQPLYGVKLWQNAIYTDVFEAVANVIPIIVYQESNISLL